MDTLYIKDMSGFYAFVPLGNKSTPSICALLSFFFFKLHGIDVHKHELIIFNSYEYMHQNSLTIINTFERLSEAGSP